MHWEEKRSSISIAAVGNSILETNPRYKKEHNDEEMEEKSGKRIFLFSSWKCWGWHCTWRTLPLCLRMWTWSLPYLQVFPALFQHCFYNLKKTLWCLIFWRQKKSLCCCPREDLAIGSNPFQSIVASGSLPVLQGDNMTDKADQAIYIHRLV